MTKQQRTTVAAILARYLVTPTAEDAETLRTAAEYMSHVDPIRNAIEATLCIGYHDEVNSMEYVLSGHDEVDRCAR